MFCTQCGVRFTTRTQRLCPQCGAPQTPAPGRQDQGAATVTQGQDGWYEHAPVYEQFRQPSLMTYVVVKDSGLRTVLIVLGALLLLALAVPLFFGSLLMGVMLVGTILHPAHVIAVLVRVLAHLAPAIAMCMVVVWLIANLINGAQKRTAGKID